MKTRFLISFIGFAISFYNIAQNEFVPGFYLVNKNAKYAQRGHYPDYELSAYIVEREIGYNEYNGHYEESDELEAGYGNVTTLDGDYLFISEPPSDLIFDSNLNEGQVVIGCMLLNSNVYCLDLNGNEIVFSSLNDLTKAPSTGSLGLMNSDSAEELMDGPTLWNGFYWILSQNTTNGTVKIQLPKSTVDIPSEKIIFWKKRLTNYFENAFESNTTEGNDIQITIVK